MKKITKLALKFELKLIKSGWEDKLPGGLADEDIPEGFDQEQLEMGQKVEMEHTDDPETAKEIGMDHLKEHEKYYTALKHMENLLEELGL